MKEKLYTLDKINQKKIVRSILKKYYKFSTENNYNENNINARQYNIKSNTGRNKKVASIGKS